MIGGFTSGFTKELFRTRGLFQISGFYVHDANSGAPVCRILAKFWCQRYSVFPAYLNKIIFVLCDKNILELLPNSKALIYRKRERARQCKTSVRMTDKTIKATMFYKYFGRQSQL